MTAPDARIHAQASIGFGRAAEVYDRGRPDYPQSAVDHLVHVLDINPQSHVVELGAGTGKCTTRLTATGATVIAVEPVASMRNRLAERLPGVKIVDGTAEAIPLPDLSVDAVVVAQAFHWFDGPRALAEIHRILKPGGGLGLVWNVRNEALPWVHKLTAILDQREGDVPQYRTLKWMAAFKSSALFSPLETRVFEHVQLLTPTKLRDRVASISFVAALPEVERAAVLDQVRELVQSEPAIRGLGEFEMPYRTFTYWCRKS
ncbi:MAG TPA: methyltransferase domain-containing protein [Planctomycetaceae bacterium]|jgi:ubiquinone/menaquinone biosynthesis C-methylase UbiE|nr:methyltransferase domain-containing protein [Planctomycetaceae bacterium]